MLKLIPLICGLIGLLVSITYYSWVRRSNSAKRDSKQLRSFALDSSLFHRVDWMTIIITIIVLCVVTGIFIGWFDAGLYVYGAAVSIAIEYLAGHILARGKLEYSETDEPAHGFSITYRTGVAAGLFIASFGLLALGAIFVPFKLKSAVTAIACYAFGCSTVALFNSTNYKPIADIYESYIETIVSVIILSTLAVNSSDITSTFNTRTAAIFPLILAGIGVLASVIGSTFVKGRKNSHEKLGINFCVVVTSLLVVLASAFLGYRMLQSYVYAVAVAVGVVCGVLTGITAAKKLTLIPVFLFAASIIAPFKLIGLYGIALSALGFMAVTAMLIAVNSYGMITGFENSITKLGNGYSTCASAITVLALFVAYTDVTHLVSVNIIEPTNLAGLLVGVIMPIIYVMMSLRTSEDRNYSFFMDILAIFIPVVFGILLGTEALGAVLGGLVTSGMIVSFIVNSNIDIDGENSNKIVVISSINTLIKYMTITALVFAPVFSKFGGLFI